MSQENELARLEEFVSKLLEKFSKLKEENARLASDLKDREEAIAELEDRVESGDMEKIEIGDRVSRIIEKIEDWEDTLGGAAAEESDKWGGTPAGAEDVEEAAQEEEKVSEEGGVPLNDPSRQGSLFHVAGDELEEAE